MKILGNLLWLIFGGLEAAIGYFTASMALGITIIGLPLALQTFKLGLLCLWPFGAEISSGNSSLSMGCLHFILGIIWLIFGGLWAFICHIFFGILLSITIVGLPWGLQHFKMASLALMPFGKNIKIGM